MGLGGLKALSVKDAWDLAYGYRTLVAKGKGPIEHRRKQRRDAMRNLHLLKGIDMDALEKPQTCPNCAFTTLSARSLQSQS